MSHKELKKLDHGRNGIKDKLFVSDEKRRGLLSLLPIAVVPIRPKRKLEVKKRLPASIGIPFANRHLRMAACCVQISVGWKDIRWVPYHADDLVSVEWRKVPFHNRVVRFGNPD